MTDTTIVRGRWVVTTATCPPVCDACVVVKNGVVTQVMDWELAEKQYPDATVLGGPGFAVIPGFINAHHHSHAIPSILHGISDNVLEPWIMSWQAMRPTDRYLSTQISAGIQLASGVTSVVDMLSTGGDANSVSHTVEQAISAYASTGIRASQAIGCSTRSHLISGEGEDQKFLDSLPSEIRKSAESLLPQSPRIDDHDYFAVMDEHQQITQKLNRIDLWYGPPGPQWVSEELLTTAAEKAQQWNCGIQTHVNESYYEKLHGHRFYGKPTMKHLNEMGVLSSRFTIAHGTWLDDQEIGICADTGAAVSHNPSSNLRLRAGVAPFKKLLDTQVTTGIGMDSTTINDNEDMFDEIRLATRLQCDPHIDGSVPHITDTLSACLDGGARLMGKQELVGKLDAGYSADLVLVNLKNITWPWLSPEADPMEVVYSRANKSDITLVMVEGEIVCESGRPTRFNLEDSAQDLVAQMALEHFPEARQKAVNDVLPHLEHWYANWHQ